MGTLTGGRQKDREKLTAISKWRVVPLALATVWVGWGDGQNSHFSWAWLPATWKLISQVDSSVLRLEALAGVCAEVGQLQPSSLSPETQPAQAPGRATELILPPSLASKPQGHEGESASHMQGLWVHLSQRIPLFRAIPKTNSCFPGEDSSISPHWFKEIPEEPFLRQPSIILGDQFSP